MIRTMLLFLSIAWVATISALSPQKEMVGLRLGLDNFSLAQIKKLGLHEAARIGLVTNQTGKDQKGNRSVDILIKKRCNIVALFAPEHGLEGKVAAGKECIDCRDKKTGIMVKSLYGKGSGKKVKKEHADLVDLFIFDMQDAGMRHYTYISTLFCLLQAAADYGKPVIVLDRPNPLGCCMHGPLVDEQLQSFISIASIPLRHGMTIGELAHYFNRQLLGNKVALHIVRMDNYERDKLYLADHMAKLSPNLQSCQSCFGYSFLGLLGEIEPFDVGIGTPFAFRSLALPKKIASSPNFWQKVQQLLSSYAIESTPYTLLHHKKKIHYTGLRLAIKNVATIDTFSLLLDLLTLFKQAKIPLSFSACFDKAVGTRMVQESIGGSIARQQLKTILNQQINSFFHSAKDSFLYLPHPRIASVK